MPPTAQASASPLSTASAQFRVVTTAKSNTNTAYKHVQVAVQLDSPGSVTVVDMTHVIRGLFMVSIISLLNRLC